MVYKIWSLMMLVMIQPVQAGMVSVGPGSDCDYNTSAGETLQDALNDMSPEIRLVDTASYMGSFVTQGSVNLRGGFTSCADANANNQFSTLSRLDADFNGVVLDLLANGNYRIEQIELVNGASTSSTGSGLKISAPDLVVTVIDSKISSNTANVGGGIGKASNVNAILNVINTEISGNTANIGGGIYFKGVGQLNFFGNSSVSFNSSSNNAGGVFLEDTVAVFVGGSSTDINAGITFNTSAKDGGGLFIRNSDVEFTGGYYQMNGFGLVGDLTQTFNIQNNTSDLDNNGIGSGGGLAAIASNIDMAAVSVTNNQSKSSAGGIWAISNSVLNIKRTLYPHLNTSCSANILNGCNEISDNLASAVGGGLYLSSGTKGHIEATNINGNRANNSTAAFVTGATTDVTIQASLVYDNGENGTVPYNDNYVLRVNDNADLLLNHVTAIENNGSLAFIYNNNGNLLSYYNYFYNQTTGPWFLENGNVSTSFNCMVVDDTNNQTDTNTNLLAINSFDHSLQFVDKRNRDLHLKDDSDLIDFQLFPGCPVNPLGTSVDMDGDNRSMYADLGADENLINDIIFENGFEEL